MPTESTSWLAATLGKTVYDLEQPRLAGMPIAPSTVPATCTNCTGATATGTIPGARARAAVRRAWS